MKAFMVSKPSELRHTLPPSHRSQSSKVSNFNKIVAESEKPREDSPDEEADLYVDSLPVEPEN